jgi:branched-subunit amino acid transport protein
MGGFKHGDYYDIILWMVIASILINLLGIFVFLFIFWKRLREDYSSEIIFKTAFEILIGILIGSLLSLKFPQAGFFWLAILGALMGLTLAILSLKVKFYETFEALIISSFPWVSFVFLLDSITHASLSSFFAFIAILVLVFISYYLDAHYKNFTWYKSGKIGFAGIVTVALFFITRALLAIFGISMVSFVSLRFEALISGSAAFICFILLYNLARIKE